MDIHTLSLREPKAPQKLLRRGLEIWKRRIAAWRTKVEDFAYSNNDWEGFAVRKCAAAQETPANGPLVRSLEAAVGARGRSRAPLGESPRRRVTPRGVKEAASGGTMGSPVTGSPALARRCCKIESTGNVDRVEPVSRVKRYGVP